MEHTREALVAKMHALGVVVDVLIEAERRVMDKNTQAFWMVNHVLQEYFAKTGEIHKEYFELIEKGEGQIKATLTLGLIGLSVLVIFVLWFAVAYKLGV